MTKARERSCETCRCKRVCILRRQMIDLEMHARNILKANGDTPYGVLAATLATYCSEYNKEKVKSSTTPRL